MRPSFMRVVVMKSDENYEILFDFFYFSISLPREAGAVR